jgi:hypothetical protein
MNNVLSALNSKSIYCSFLLEILADHISSPAIKYSHSEVLQIHHDSEEYFVFG